MTQNLAYPESYAALSDADRAALVQMKHALLNDVSKSEISSFYEQLENNGIGETREIPKETADRLRAVMDIVIESVASAAIKPASTPVTTSKRERHYLNFYAALKATQSMDASDSEKRQLYATIFLSRLNMEKDPKNKELSDKTYRLLWGDAFNLAPEEFRDPFFMGLDNSGLLETFFVLASRTDSYAQYAPKMVLEWSRDNNVDLEERLIHWPVPLIKSLYSGVIAFADHDGILEEARKKFVPLIEEKQELTGTAESNASDIDAIIAEKQKFFDETSALDLQKVLLNATSVDPESDEFKKSDRTLCDHLENTSSRIWMKREWKFVSQQDWPTDMKKVHALRALLESCDRGYHRKLQVIASSHPFDKNVMRNIWESGFSESSTRDYIFESARRNNYLPELYFFAAMKDTMIPSDTVSNLLAWTKKHNIDLKQMLVDYEISPLTDEPELAIDAAEPALETLQLPDAQPEPETDPVSVPDNIDAIIAEKQKFFDEVETDDLITFFNQKFNASKTPDDVTGIADKFPQIFSNNSIKNLWREIHTMQAPESIKQMMFRVQLTVMVDRGLDFYEETIGQGSTHKVKKRIADAFSDPGSRDYIFEAARRYNILPELYFVANAKDTLFPPHASGDLEEWCERKNIDLKQLLVDYEISPLTDEPELAVDAAEPVPETLQLPEAQPEPAIDPMSVPKNVVVVEVDGRLVEVGRAAEMLAADKQMDEDAPKRERQWVPHVEWLLEDIPKLVDLDGPITLYRSRQERAKGEDRDFSLQVIEFKTTDGRKHQIATNNWYGGGTYVIKPPVDINPNDPKLVHIPDLLGSGKAWPIRCFKRDQFVLTTLEHCEKKLADMEPYIPRLSWANKALEVVQTCVAILHETGEKIRTNDKTPLQTGPLRGVSTPSRVAAAVNNGAVANLGADDLNGLYGKLFEEQPGLKEHLHKPSVSAKKIFDDAVNFIIDNDIVPQNGFLDEIELAGHRADQLSRFFSLSAEGCVTGWREILPGQHQIPVNLDDFMVASGLAVKTDKGELWPNYDHPALASAARKLAHG